MNPKPQVTRIESVEAFKKHLRGLIRGYEFTVEGLYLKDGTILPLPSEASVVGKVVELTIKAYMQRKLVAQRDLRFTPAGDRTYPDLTFNGPVLGPMKIGVDVKCARREPKNRVRTQSAITIATYDAEYFHYPTEKVANILLPYADYTAHLSIIALYDYEKATARNLELLVVEKWRVATKRRSSGTRSYVAAVSEISKLRAEQGEFSSDEEFNEFWRSQPVKESKRREWERRRKNRLL